MLVILASRHDQFAAAAVGAWAPADAALCTPEDLSVAGWQYRIAAPQDAIVVTGGIVTPAAAITGVWTRLPVVAPEELTHIEFADRAYVAAEMTAFLIAFLAALRCPVLNRPGFASLSGPGWRQEQWIRAAVRVGVPVRSVRRIVRPDVFLDRSRDTPDAELTIIGRRVFGSTDVNLTRWARAISAASNTQLLSLRFARQGDGYALVGVNPWPDVSFAGGVDAIRDYLLTAPDTVAAQ